MYEGMKRIVFENGATFIPVCEQCGRFIKADFTVTVNGVDELVDRPNATCSKHGRVKMVFEGYC